MRGTFVTALAGLTAVLGSFLLGVLTGHYRTWPYDLIWSTRRTVLGEAGAPYLGETERNRAELFRAMDGTADIVMLGDSLMELGNWHESFPRCDILNRGISGDTIHGIELRLDEVMQRRPRAVFLLAGGNDLNAGTDARLIAETYERTLRRLGRSSVVVAHSVLPCSGTACPNSRAIAVARLNRRLEGIAERTGTRWLDLVSSVAPNGSLEPHLTHDGQHLNAEGYRRWRAMIVPLLGDCAR